MKHYRAFFFFRTKTRLKCASRRVSLKPDKYSNPNLCSKSGVLWVFLSHDTSLILSCFVLLSRSCFIMRLICWLSTLGTNIQLWTGRCAVNQLQTEQAYHGECECVTAKDKYWDSRIKLWGSHLLKPRLYLFFYWYFFVLKTLFHYLQSTKSIFSH